MQKAELVLNILSEKSAEERNYKFRRLYRILFNPDMYMIAYSNIYSHEGNMTAGADGKTIDGFSMELISKIIEEIKRESYHPQPVRRTYIPKKNGKKRPLGISSFRDKLVQEAVRMILNAIYEPVFSKDSHGFRPNRSCQTALYQAKTIGIGTNWVIEGDIERFYGNIDHDVLLALLKEKIDDGRFIELIRRFLKAGYIEFNKVNSSLSGTSQGNITSPILANIYLTELDEFMSILSAKYHQGKVRARNPEYKRLSYQRNVLNRNGRTDEAKKVLQKMRQLPTQNMMDPKFTRMKYIRYSDDFIVLVIGSKQMAHEIRESIQEFLKDSLKLNLNMEKTRITNLGEERVRFLGYEIAKSRENSQITKNTLGIKKRSVNERIQLLVPADVIREKLEPFVKNGKPVHHNARVNEPILDIISKYNSEIRGLYNYYSLATDVSRKIGRFRFYHYYSLVKTIARKEKSSVRKVIDKYGVSVKCRNGTGTRRIVGVYYETQEGTHLMTYFNEPLARRRQPNTECERKTVIIPRCQLIKRLNANRCELCETDSAPMNVHHIRKLKDVKKKYLKRGAHAPDWVMRMAKMNRKTLVLCRECHLKIHAGRG